MQAVGVTPPVVNLKSLIAGRAEAYPAQDMFQSLLQQRILSRGYSRSNYRSGGLSRTALRSQVGRARPASSSSSSTSRLFSKMPKFTVHTASTKGSRDPLPLHVTEKLSNLRSPTRNRARSSTSTERANSSAKSWKTDRRSRMLALLQASSGTGQYAGTAVPAPLDQMPTALKGLMEFLNQQPGQALKISQEQIPLVRAFLLKAGLPAEQVEKLLNSPDFTTKGLTAADLQSAWNEACQNSREQSLAAGMMAQGTRATALSTAKLASQMPTALKDLVSFLNQQPGQNLKVPPDRIPEVENFLLKAGISPEQVENLLSSPRFQEQGLTAADVQTAWQNSMQSSLHQDQMSMGLGPDISDITSQSDYREMWDSLTLPTQSLADLRLELQQMGLAPEAVAQLNEQNFPQGVPLTKVWQLLQQASKHLSATSAALTGGKALPQSPQLLNGAEDVEKWRHFLVQAGMDPELARTLVSGPNPTNREELQAGLLKMAPPDLQLQGQDAPKPLYLPQNVRVGAFPMWQQQQPDMGQGGNSDNGNWTRNFTFSSQPQGVNLAGVPDLNNFLALITGDASPNAQQFMSPEVAGSPASTVTPLLTPEAREALWTQVQTGIMGNLRPGANQVTLTLNPPDMGKLHLSLNVRGDSVQVSAIASHVAVAEAGAAGVQQLAQALNQQGLTLTQFQFHHQDEAPGQSNLGFFQNSGGQRQTGKNGADRWDQPPNPRRQRWGRGIDCFV